MEQIVVVFEDGPLFNDIIPLPALTMYYKCSTYEDGEIKIYKYKCYGTNEIDGNIVYVYDLVK